MTHINESYSIRSIVIDSVWDPTHWDPLGHCFQTIYNSSQFLKTSILRNCYLISYIVIIQIMIQSPTRPIKDMKSPIVILLRSDQWGVTCRRIEWDNRQFYIFLRGVWLSLTRWVWSWDKFIIISSNKCPKSVSIILPDVIICSISLSLSCLSSRIRFFAIWSLL